MADPYSEPGYFDGSGPKECEIFVATIRRRALEQGKHRDNEWIAFLASSYLIGDAVYWYECLGEDVQNDWSRLRPALMARFGRPGSLPAATSSKTVIPAFASSATIPTAAAAPPVTAPRSLIRKGRLKVQNSDGSLRGYLAKSGDLVGLYRTWSTDPEGAILISFTTSPSGEAFEVQIIDDPQSSQVNDCLAVCWEGLSNYKWQTDPTYVASSCSFSTISTKPWAIAKKAYTISKDDELHAEYPTQSGGFERLQPFIRQYANRIHWLRPSGLDEDDHVPVRIVVEDIM